jgi:eukaryotic-like serine/threonine-protein kinase
MNACPSQDLLVGMLENRLNGVEFDGIVVHIEICIPCQAQLEDLTRCEVWKSTLREAPVDLELNGGEVARSYLQGGNPTVDAPGGRGIGEDEPASDGGSTDPASHDQDSPDDHETQSRSDAPGDSVRPGWSGALPTYPQIPGYEILKHLGEGGMGIVYKARQVGLNRLVALKMIRGGSQVRPDHRARFAIEAEAVARLRHANILQIYDIGEADGMPFVSLELLEGGSLADRLDGTPQPARSSAELLSTLALAIVAAHQAGIIHRDLKPSNVLFNEDGEPKVTDFGLAKRLDTDDHQTESGQVMGSPSYMAPEQARGHTRDVGPAADVYALGAILYEMLTGRPPFKGESPIETIRQVIADDPVAPSRLVPRVARDLETICLKCLQKEWNKRYRSAQAFADDLGRYLNREPIKARPTPPWERAAKWAHRSPIASSLVAMGALIASGAVFAGFAHDRRVRNEIIRTAADRSQTNEVIYKAQQERSRGDLPSLRSAQSSLGKLVGQLEVDGRQRDLFGRAASELEQIEELLAVVSTRDANSVRYQQFQRGRTEALIQDSQFTDLDLPSNKAATRGAAGAALEVFGTPRVGGWWELAPLPASLSDRERDDVTQGFYELLLILADAMDHPAEGLRHLDSAAGLRPLTRAYHQRRAGYLAKAGDRPGSEKERRAAEALLPTTASDHFLIGCEQYKREEFRTANRHFDLALRLQADHLWAQCMSALCYLRLQQHSEARVNLDACVRRGPEYAWFYVWRATASGQLAARANEQLKKQPSLANTGLREDADHHFEAAIADYNQARALLEKKADNVCRWVLLVNRGSLFVQREQWDQAAPDLEAAIRLDGRRPLAYTVLAGVYKRQNKPDAAFEQYSRAISLNPKWAALYRARAGVAIERKDRTPAHRASALRDLNDAIRFESPANPVVAYDHTNRATLLLADHLEAEALAACDAAIKVRPRHHEAHQLRIRVLLEMKKYDDVIRSCDALLVDERSSAPLYELRGLARAGLKDFPGAIDDFTQAIEIQPDLALHYVRRGGFYLVSDAPKLARRDFEEATRLDPSNGDALVGRGAARVRLGEHHQAVTDAEKGISMANPTALRLYQAARIYARAAAVARAEVRKNGHDTVSLVDRYQDRGTALLRGAIKKLPGANREAFWRDVVQKDADPAMNALRRRLRSGELAGPAF